jgi:hypothetical protein
VSPSRAYASSMEAGCFTAELKLKNGLMRQVNDNICPFVAVLRVRVRLEFDGGIGRLVRVVLSEKP